MDNISLGAMIAVITCGLAATHLSGGMAAQVRLRTGRKHVPVMLNFNLAQSYRELFGSTGTYWQFMILNVLYILALLIFGVTALVQWMHK